MLRKVLYLTNITRINKFYLLSLISIQTLIDLAGVGLVFPLVKFLLNGYSTLYLEILNISISLNFFIIIILSLFIIKFFFSIFLNFQILIFGKNIKVNLQKILIRQHQKMSYLNFISRDRSYYLFKSETLTKNFSDLITSLMRMFSEIFVAFFIIIFLGFLNLKLLITIVVLFIFSTILFDFFFKKKLFKLGKISNRIYSKSLKCIYDVFDGYLDIKIFNKEKFFLERAITASKNAAMTEAKYEIVPISSKYYLELIIMLIFSVSFLFFLKFKSHNFIIDSLPTILTFGVASIKLMPIFNTLIRTNSLVRRFKDAINILYNDFNSINNIPKNKTKEIIQKKQKFFSENENFNQLKIKSLNYFFKKKQILRDVNITIKKNDFVGIIGESGSGKTSLINIICGIYNDYTGNIFVNEKNLKEYIDEWKTKISYIPQSSFVIDDSFKKNILFDNSKMNELLFNRAISKANLTSTVKQNKSGIEFKIGDKGSKISGGQKQRLLIARSFYHNREIIIFDESTSALDTETESKIFKDLIKFKGSFTAIFISHNKNILKFCNKVYLLKNQRAKLIKNNKKN